MAQNAAHAAEQVWGKSKAQLDSQVQKWHAAQARAHENTRQIVHTLNVVLPHQPQGSKASLEASTRRLEKHLKEEHEHAASTSLTRPQERRSEALHAGFSLR